MRSWLLYCIILSNYKTIAATLLFFSYPTIMRSRALCYFFQLPDDRGHGAIYFYSNYHTIAATVPHFIYFHLPYHRGNCALSFISPFNYHTIAVTILLFFISNNHKIVATVLFFLFLCPATLRSHPRYLPLLTQYHAITVRKFFKLNRILKFHTFTC